ncbi:MAG: VanZ family protein [Candidatus Binatia bacterium]
MECNALIPLLLWIGLILGIASRPKTVFLDPDTRVIYRIPRVLIPYAYHGSAFFILAILFLRHFLSRSDGKIARKTEALSLLGSALVSICSELIQLYVPTRTPAFRDLAIDLLGAALGIFFMRRRHHPINFTSSVQR